MNGNAHRLLLLLGGYSHALERLQAITTHEDAAQGLGDLHGDAPCLACRHGNRPRRILDDKRRALTNSKLVGSPQRVVTSAFPSWLRGQIRRCPHSTARHRIIPRAGRSLSNENAKKERRLGAVYAHHASHSAPCVDEPNRACN